MDEGQAHIGVGSWGEAVRWAAGLFSPTSVVGHTSGPVKHPLTSPSITAVSKRRMRLLTVSTGLITVSEPSTTGYPQSAWIGFHPLCPAPEGPSMGVETVVLERHQQ